MNDRERAARRVIQHAKAVADAVKLLGTKFPGIRDRYPSEEYYSLLAEGLQKFTPTDIVRGARLMIFEEEQLYPNSNDVAILRRYCVQARGERYTKEDKAKKELETKERARFEASMTPELRAKNQRRLQLLARGARNGLALDGSCPDHPLLPETTGGDDEQEA